MTNELHRALHTLAVGRERHVHELVTLLRQPTVSADPARAEDLRRCAAWLVEHFVAIGLTNCRVLPTAGHPAAYGEWLGAPGQPTVLIYGHYDVQPPEPLDLWETPPFEPTVRAGKIYARGATDDKGQFFAHVKAIEAMLANGGRLPVNVKLLIEGEEEIGSPNLAALVVAETERLRADMVAISDSPMLGPGQPAICYALRGIAYLEVRLTTATRDLHSGGYGGTVPNAPLALAQLLAACRAPDGRITIPGFYDDVLPLSAAERANLAALPWDEAAFMAEPGLTALPGEPGYTPIERMGARPSFEVHGVWGGYAGPGAKTVIPCEAGAKISARLVPNQAPDRVAAVIERHLQTKCPPGARLSVETLAAGYPAMTPLDHPATRAAARALASTFGVEPRFTREGGSIPVVATFQQVLAAPTVLLGFGLPDEPLHAPNEHFDLGNYARGAETVVRFLHELANPSA